MKTGREPLTEAVHGGDYGRGGGHRVCAGRQIEANRYSGLVVEAAFDILILSAKFYSRYVMHTQQGAVGIRAKNDVAELLRGRQAALRLNVQLKLLVFTDRPCPDAADGRLNILGLDRGNDVGRRKLQVVQPLRVEPDAHRIVERPEDARLPDARQSRQHVHDIDDRVVGDEQGVLLPVVAIQREELQDRR